jgi:hypothetical protein
MLRLSSDLLTLGSGKASCSRPESKTKPAREKKISLEFWSILIGYFVKSSSIAQGGLE